MESAKTGVNQRAENALILGLMGVTITLFVQLRLSATLNTRFLLAMSALFLIGFIFRVARRKTFFGSRHTLHQALSFDALLQGAVILNPQLPYPDVEQSFICRQGGFSPFSIQGWFFLRPTAAIVIPAALVGMIGLLSGYILIGTLAWGGALITMGYRGLVFERGYGVQTAAWRFVLAMILGLLAVLGEGVCFVAAGRYLGLTDEIWQLFCLYAVTVTIFELSPVPLSLGILELAFFATASILLFSSTALALVLAYRLFRAIPIVGLTLFYLPRYKLSLLDLYRPDLFLALNQVWQPSRQVAENPGAPLLSIVIPAYNEEKRLPVYLPVVVNYFMAFPAQAEILVVDDGSTDGTVAYVESLIQEQGSVRLIRQPENRGKGAAVRRGVLEARGTYVLFADADGATPIEETSKLLAMARKGGDVIIASRQLEGSQAARSFFRNLLGTVFYRLTNLLAVPGISDTQCGFKLFSHEAAQRLFPLLREEGWAFDVELLYLAQKLGMSIVEVPVHWTSIEGSKVNPIRDAWKMLQALHRIRTRWTGLQNPPDAGP